MDASKIVLDFADWNFSVRSNVQMQAAGGEGALLAWKK